MRSLLLLVVALITVISLGRAEAQRLPEARIVSVVATSVWQSVERSGPVFPGRRISLPGPGVRRERVPVAVLDVAWRALGVLPGGVEVRFSFRRAAPASPGERVRSFPRPVTGVQRTRFEVPLERDGRDRVVAWRLQVMQGGRVLDQAHSAGWN